MYYTSIDDIPRRIERDKQTMLATFRTGQREKFAVCDRNINRECFVRLVTEPIDKWAINREHREESSGSCGCNQSKVNEL